ncbi:sensor histidine kinase [Oerskovia turbata]|uniref:histidine kinase n=1 Tax=Oerskovia turbata TaxID=1713 RepID=A0A4Q1KRV5_9CELL|nr:sensor histidine kinase [Oerskovia turbata]RXR32375.1 sensor histidine kinase [Oerskovia turbata]TGJ95320.1 sensor histidine kinase [Actinotalea fermentans ATCC 43279 = JCM 9966 = DSM 3133]
MAGPQAVSASGSALGRFEESWDRVVVWWDVGFYVVVLLSALAVFLSGVEPDELVPALAAIAVILLAYTFLGRRAARNRDQRLAVSYLLILIVATDLAVVHNHLGTFLLFGAFTQIWMLSERRWVSLVLSTLLAVGTTLALTAASGFSREALTRAAPQMGVALAFSILLGIWVGQTMLQTARHAQLVDDLHAAQAELGTVHHAAGVAAERERMAREIHDTLAQGFTSVVMLAQAASADLDRADTAAARDRLALVETTARDNLAEARSLVTAFAPLPLQGATLVEAVERLAARFEDESGVAVTLRLSAVPGLGSAEDVVLLRSAQEALANVRRHAQASCVVVSLGPGRPEGTVPDGATVVLEVTDDGRGLGPGVVEGFGLRGMRERVAAGDGTVRVVSPPGGGTSVRVELPVPADHPADAPPQPASLPRSRT